MATHQNSLEGGQANDLAYALAREQANGCACALALFHEALPQLLRNFAVVLCGSGDLDHPSACARKLLVGVRREAVEGSLDHTGLVVVFLACQVAATCLFLSA